MLVTPQELSDMAVECLQSAERLLMEAEASKSKAELVRAVTEP